MFKKRDKDNLSWRVRFRIEKVLKKFAKNISVGGNGPKGFLSHSEASQDLFVLKMTRAKKQGTYVEIGSGHPTSSNNTYLLENKYSWSGVSVELSSGLAQEFQATRLNPVINADATALDYLSLFSKYSLPKEIDYLQIDIDPALQSLQVLRNIPFERYKFSVITFEHDRYRADRRIAKESRVLLKKLGYKLVVKNVTLETLKPFEDWWVHPDLVSKEISTRFQTSMKKPNHFNWN